METTGHQWDSRHKGPVMWDIDLSFDVSLNKLSKKQSSSRWFAMYWSLFDVAAMIYWKICMNTSHDICIMFVWRKHENMSPCTGSRVNTNYERITSWSGCQCWTGNPRILETFFPNYTKKKMLENNYRKISNISHTKSQNLKCFSSRLAVVFAQYIYIYIFIYIVKLRMKLDQLHLSDQQFNCLLNCVLYWVLTVGFFKLWLRCLSKLWINCKNTGRAPWCGHLGTACGAASVAAWVGSSMCVHSTLSP